jgi:hypothetical protein
MLWSWPTEDEPTLGAAVVMPVAVTLWSWPTEDEPTLGAPAAIPVAVRSLTFDALTPSSPSGAAPSA